MSEVEAVPYWSPSRLISYSRPCYLGSSSPIQDLIVQPLLDGSWSAGVWVESEFSSNGFEFKACIVKNLATLSSLLEAWRSGPEVALATHWGVSQAFRARKGLVLAGPAGATEKSVEDLGL